jgi:hypothetical protein
MSRTVKRATLLPAGGVTVRMEKHHGSRSTWETSQPRRRFGRLGRSPATSWGTTRSTFSGSRSGCYTAEIVRNLTLTGPSRARDRPVRWHACAAGRRAPPPARPPAMAPPTSAAASRCDDAQTRRSHFHSPVARHPPTSVPGHGRPASPWPPRRVAHLSARRLPPTTTRPRIDPRAKGTQPRAA